MQHCGKCGNYNSQDSIFCGHCGNRLNNNCPDCGFRNLMQQKFCGNCGKQLLMDAALGEAPPHAPSLPAGVPHAPTAPAAGSPKTPAPQASVSPEIPEARFDAHADLDAYALASIELMNWEQAASIPPEQLDAHRAQCLESIVQKITGLHGQINASKKNILFVSFKREASLQASLEKAIDAALDLLETSFQVEGAKLPLRIGLDLEVSNARNPLTSTLERSVGEPGTLTVSERVQQLMSEHYRMEPVGPVAIGNRSMQFYRVVKPGTALPDVAQVVAPAEPSPAAPHPVLSVTPVPVAAPASAPVSAAPPEMPVVPPSPVSSAVPPTPQVPQTETGMAAAPTLPVYHPPTLGVIKAPRSESMTYDMAVEALTSDLSAFIAQGGATGKGKVLALCAADGLGKSNIVHMARAAVDPEGQRAIWMGAHNYRCFHRAGLPLFYWLELIQNLLGLGFEGLPAREVRVELSKFLGMVYESEEPPADVMAVLSDLLSIQPPQPISVESRANLGRLEAFLLRFFSMVASKRPLIVVMEDLHLADPATLDVLQKLLEYGLLQAPVYWIVTHTRDFYLSGPLGDALQKAQYRELSVAPLDDAAAERFLDDGPLGGHLTEFPAQLIDSILRQARGLPLYLEEALRLLHLKEILLVAPDTGKFVMNREAEQSGWTLPESMKVLIQARFGYLDEQAQYVMRLASVLGEKFSVNVLYAMAQLDEDPFNQALTTLFNHGFLVPDAVNTGRFRHGLIWEAVFEDIEPDLRVQMHQLLSEALESDFNQAVTINPALIAYHSQLGQMPNRALNYWNLAGIYAGQNGSLVGLNVSMFKALDLLKQTVSEPLHTQELALRMMENTGIFNLDADPELAAGLLEWTFFYRRNEGDPLRLIEPLGYLASAYEHKGDLPKALVTLDKALSFIDPQQYPQEAAALQINKMEYQFILGRMQQARELMEQVIEPVAARQGQSNPEFQDALLQARLLQAQIMLAQCESEAATVIESAMRQARERRLDGLVLAFQLAMGQVYLRNGDYDRCNREADGLLTSIEAMPGSDWLLAQWGLLAMMYHCELEDWTSASQLVLTVVSKSEAVHDYHTWVVAQAYAGYISGKMGKVKEGRQLIEQAIGLSSEHRFAAAALIGWRFLADFELSLKNVDVAYEIAVKALDIAQKPDIRHAYESIQLSLIAARALLQKGQPKEAGKLLEPLWPRVVQSRWQPLIADCAYEIGQLYKSLAQNVPADLSRKYLTRSVEFFLKAKGIWLELRLLARVKHVDAVIPKL